jgi:hypothetical protein
MTVTPNEDEVGGADPGEVHITPGTLRLPDGTTRTLAADAEIRTPFEGATTPPVTGGTFYILWGLTAPDVRFGSGVWGNAVAEAAGFFTAYYSTGGGWVAIDDIGTTYPFTPTDDDIIFAVGFKNSASGGIDSMSPLAPYSGDLGLLDSVPVGAIDPDVVGTLELADLAVTNAKVAVDAIETINIAPLAITAVEIDNATITDAKIAVNAITGDSIALDTILGANIAGGAVTSAEIAVNTILGSNIAPGEITGTLIAADTVAGSNIIGGTITGTNIAGGTITGDKVAAETIQAGNIAARTITGDRLTGNSISAIELAANAVLAGNIAAGQVTANALSVSAVTADKLAANSVTSSKIVAASIQGGDIAANTIVGSNLVGATITGDKIQGNTITGTNIAGQTITGNNIAANTIAADRMAVSTLSSITANVGNLTAGVIDASLVSTGILDSNVIQVDDLTISRSGNFLIVKNLGISSAKIQDAAITNAKIGNAEVSTLKIAGQSVTVPWAHSFDWGSGLTLTSGAWQKVAGQSGTPLFTIPTVAGVTPMLITWSLEMAGQNADAPPMSIRVDAEGVGTIYQSNANTNNKDEFPAGSFEYDFSPGSYRLPFYVLITAGDPQKRVVYRASVSAVAVMR